MKRAFRDVTPTRNCTQVYKNYRQYKSHLIRDFSNKCGYTGCPDHWFGGSGTFHIDHFIPWKKHWDSNPGLKTDYSNLVYACSYVNILKSDDDESNYLDPCSTDYNEHFYRDRHGRIFPNTESVPANYMYKRLKLYLARYQIIWLLEEVTARIEKIDALMIESPDHAKKNKMKDLKNELLEAFYVFVKYLRKC